MTEENVMFGITLEDYSKPRFENGVSLYCGNKGELSTYLNMLGGKQWTKDRYAQILKAFSNMDSENKPKYHLCGKDYSAYPPLQMIYSQVDYLRNHHWDCCTHDDSIYHLYAPQVIVNQVLVKDYDYLYRFIRVKIRGSQVNIQGHGWVELKDQFQGFPCIYSYKDGWHVMNLHICDEIYDWDEDQKAISELKNMDEPDLLNITRDLLAEGINGW